MFDIYLRQLTTLNASYYSLPFPSALLCVVHCHSVLSI